MISTACGLVASLAAFMFGDGAFAIITGIRAAPSGERWGLLLLLGIAHVAAGITFVLWWLSGHLLEFSWNVTHHRSLPEVLFWIVTIWAITSGALMIAAASLLKTEYGRWWLALVGIVALVFGILNLNGTPPLVGEAAVLLLPWIGTYAFVSGVLLLVLAFRLHRNRPSD